MEVVKDAAILSSKALGHSPFLASVCKENSSSLIKKDSVIVITDSSLDFFSIKNGKLRTTLPLIGINSISLDKSVIRIKIGGKSFQIISVWFIKDIFGAILHTLQQILPWFEYKGLGLARFNYPRVNHTGYGAWIRFQELLKSGNKTLTPSILEKVRISIMSNQEDIDLSQFTDPVAILHQYLSILPLLPFVTCLSLPPMEKIDIYRVLNENTSCVSGLNYLDIGGKFTKSFTTFFDRIGSLASCNLSSYSFTDSNFGKKELNYLSSFIGRNRITGLGFHNAIEVSAYDDLFSSFFKPHIASFLQILNFDNTKDIDINRLMPLVRNISVLSLDNCNLNIDSIFTSINTAEMPFLKTINISHNKCVHFPATAISFPQTLINVIANNIEWGEYCLSNILRNLLTRKVDGVKLSFTNATCVESEWQRVFAVFSGLCYTGVSAFCWDSNPVHSNIFEFLKNNLSIEFISFSDCFSMLNEDILNTFAQFLESLKSLTHLILRGSVKHYIGRNMSTIVNIISKKKNLIHLDISDNRLGDQGLQQIKPLFSDKSHIRYISFDNSFPDNPETLFDIITLALRCPEICVSVPVNDLTRMLENGAINYDVYYSQVQRFQRLNTEKKQENFSDFEFPSYSPFTEPFSIHVNTGIEHVPKFLTKNEIERLKTQPILRSRLEDKPAKLESQKDVNNILGNLDATKRAPSVSGGHVGFLPEKDTKSINSNTVRSTNDIRSNSVSTRSTRLMRKPVGDYQIRQRKINLVPVASIKPDPSAGSMSKSTALEVPDVLSSSLKQSEQKQSSETESAKQTSRSSIQYPREKPSNSSRKRKVLSEYKRSPITEKALSYGYKRVTPTSSLPKNRKYFFDPYDYSEDEIIKSPFQPGNSVFSSDSDDDLDNTPIRPIKSPSVSRMYTKVTTTNYESDKRSTAHSTTVKKVRRVKDNNDQLIINEESYKSRDTLYNSRPGRKAPEIVETTKTVRDVYNGSVPGIQKRSTSSKSTTRELFDSPSRPKRQLSSSVKNSNQTAPRDILSISSRNRIPNYNNLDLRIGRRHESSRFDEYANQEYERRFTSSQRKDGIRDSKRKRDISPELKKGYSPNASDHSELSLHDEYSICSLKMDKNGKRVRTTRTEENEIRSNSTAFRPPPIQDPPTSYVTETEEEEYYYYE